MREVIIRAVLHKDLKTVYEIERRSFKDPYPLALLDFLYDVNCKTFLVSEKDGAVIGYIIASADRDLGHVISIAINPSERKKNIGRAMMSEMLKILKGMGVRTVRLEVRKSNIEAQMFYEFLGFKLSHKIDNYYGDENALVYFHFL